MNTKATAFAALAISLVACGKETQVPGGEPTTQTEQQFLEGVAYDTPYLVTAIEPAPLAEILPWAQTLDDAAMPSPERVKELLADPDLKPRKRRALAFFAEMTGHYTPDGLAELGFSREPRFALYGIGILPAMRFEIDDATKVAAFLDRVAARAGVEATAKRSGAHDYWSYPTLRDNRIAVVALEDGVLYAGVTTPGVEEAFVAQLLSDAPAGESIDESDVESLASDWNLANYSVGYVDVARVVQFFLAPRPGLEEEMFKTLRRHDRVISDTCRTETARIASVIPRFVFGSESWSPSNLSFGAGLVIESDAMAQLAAAKTGAPLTESPEAVGAAGVAGFGFDVGRVVDIVRTHAAAVDQKPFQCEWFGGLNKAASALSSRWSILPPALTSLQGGTLLVKDLRPLAEIGEDGRPSNVETDAVLALSTEAPVELFDLLKVLSPMTQDLNLAANGLPVALPIEDGGLRKLQDPQIVAQPNGMAMTSGAWAPFTPEQLAQQSAPFLFLRYDAEKIAEQLQLGDDANPWTILRGGARLELEPTATGLHFRSSYSRDIGE